MASTISAGTTSGTALNMAGDTSGSLQLQTNGTTTAVTIDTSQNVGIGTASPAAKLQVNSATDDIFRMVATAPYLSFYNGSTRMGYIRANTGNFGIVSEDASTPMTFYTNANERMRIDSNGNLSVGRTASLARITAETTTDECIYAINSAGASSATMGSWNNASTGNNYLHVFNVNTAGDAIGSIDYNRAAGLVRYNVTSDATLKNIIGDSNGQRSLEILNTTRIRDFAWKNDTEQKTQIGVIAQELYETYKGAVSVGGENEEGQYRPWGVDKTAFTFHLIAGWQAHEKLIQELNAKVDAQATTIAELQAKVG